MWFDTNMTGGGGGGGGGGGEGKISAVDFVRLKRLVVNAFESTKVSNSVRQFYPKLESKLEQTSFCCGKCILFVYFLLLSAHDTTTGVG